MLKVPVEKLTYTAPPKDAHSYTDKMDRMYSWAAVPYDIFTVVFLPWKKWLSSVLPYIKKGKLLEVSFGPAWLMRRFPKDTEIYGLDYNHKMVCRAKYKMEKLGVPADIIQGNVECMPYPDNTFDTVINTMAFSGYPDGQSAMSEMLRVLKPDGVMLLLDYDYPPDRNWAGYLFVRFIQACGDIIKNIPQVIQKCHGHYERRIIGGAKAIQLFIITK